MRAMRKDSVVSRTVENTKNSTHFDKQGREMKEKNLDKQEVMSINKKPK